MFKYYFHIPEVVVYFLGVVVARCTGLCHARVSSLFMILSTDKRWCLGDQIVGYAPVQPDSNQCDLEALSFAGWLWVIMLLIFFFPLMWVPCVMDSCYEPYQVRPWTESGLILKYQSEACHRTLAYEFSSVRLLGYQRVLNNNPCVLMPAQKTVLTS
jgi:hypothetical protein